MRHASTLLLFFSLTWLLTACGKDEPTPEPEPQKETYLKAVVAYMTPFAYGQAAPHRKFKWSGETYTPEGLMIEREYRTTANVDPAGNFLNTETNTYEGGKLKERWVTTLTSNTRYTYSYANGLLHEVKEYGQYGLRYTSTYEYAGGNKPSRMLRYLAGSDNPTTYVYTYDSRGNAIKEVISYSTGSQITKKCEFDEKGNLTLETQSSLPDNTPVVHKIIEYKYDTKGRISEREFSTLGSINFQKYVYTYGEADRVKTIDVFVENGIGTRNYEKQGVISYEYEFAEK